MRIAHRAILVFAVALLLSAWFAPASAVETPDPTVGQPETLSISECLQEAPTVDALFAAPAHIEEWLPPRVLGEDQTAFVSSGTDMSDSSLHTTQLVQELGARSEDLEIAVWSSSTPSYPEQTAIRVAGATGVDLLVPWSRIMVPFEALALSTDDLRCWWAPQAGGAVLMVIGGLYNVAAVPLDEGLIVLRTLFGQPIDGLVNAVVAYYDALQQS